MGDDTTQPGLRIFIAENHEDTLQAMTDYLEQLGHVVFSARTVSESLALLPGLRCDVLFSDIGLPDGTGWDLLERLGQPIYAVAVSGYGQAADRERSRIAGFRHHVVKPGNPDEIDRILDEAARELRG